MHNLCRKIKCYRFDFSETFLQWLLTSRSQDDFSGCTVVFCDHLKPVTSLFLWHVLLYKHVLYCTIFLIINDWFLIYLFKCALRTKYFLESLHPLIDFPAFSSRCFNKKKKTGFSRQENCGIIVAYALKKYCKCGQTQRKRHN